MNRRFEIYQLRVDFLLVLFIENKPATTLSAPVREDLAALGHAWVHAGLRSSTGAHSIMSGPFIHCQPAKWDGIERRKSRRY